MKYPCKLLLGFSIVAGLIGSAILTRAQQSEDPSPLQTLNRRSLLDARAGPL